MAVAKASIQQTRKAMLRRMTAGSRTKSGKVVRFLNNDVPSYLRKLKQFEAWSRTASANIIVK